MAWNPTPEVQVARDAAKALTKAGRFIDRIVLLFTTEQGQIGYASYGKDSNHCGQARRLADVVYERGLEAMENIPDFHHRHGHGVSNGSDIDWKGLEKEVILKIHLLRTSINAYPGPGANGSDIDWKGLEKEVILKIHLLRTSINAYPGPGANDTTRQMYVRDLVMPAIELLGRFCNCVNIVQDEPTTGPVCDDCGCPSPEPETLHEATGIRICNACEAKAAEKAREYVRDS